MIRPRLPKLASGTRLTTDLVNDIINRTEYAADLLRQYKLTAGTDMYVEPHYDGTRVSYLQPVAGGATPKQDLNIYYIGDNEGTVENPFTSADVLRIFSDETKSINLDTGRRYYVESGVNLAFYSFCPIGFGDFYGMAAYANATGGNTIAIGLCPFGDGQPSVPQYRTPPFYIQAMFRGTASTGRKTIPGGSIKSS